MEEISFLFEGEHSDNDPSAQPPNTYREGLNGSIISYGANQFAFESSKGNKISFSLPNHAAGQLQFTPIGGHSFMDRLILFSANDAGIGATEPFPGEVGQVIMTPNGLGTYTALYYHKALRFTRQHSIPKIGGTVGKPENSSIVRVYWTENYNPLRSINVADPVYTTYFLTGSLVVGKQYMVLPGGASNNVIHNAVTYGPGEVAGNVFTAVNANYTNLARVIDYIAVETLDVVPAFNMNNIRFKHYNTNGNLFSGSYQYFYQLETADGALTNWSYVTLPIYVNGPAIPDNTFIGYQKYQGANTVTNSHKSVTITISGVDTNFKKIRVGMIRGTSFEVYKDPEVFFYDDITGASMDIIHFGNETTTKIKATDLTTAVSVVDLVGSISSTKNIFFAANVGLQGDIDYDPTGATCVTFPYLVPADLTGNITASNDIASGYGIHGQAQYQNIATGNTGISPDLWYQVYGTGTVTYNAVVYAVGDHFQGIAGTAGFVVSSGAPKVVAVHRIQKYTGVYEYFPIEKDYADYKGMITSHYMKSHWREEKYRYGMVLWSTKSQPMAVRFMKDKTFPSQYATTDPDSGAALGYDPRLCEYYVGSLECSLRLLGARFSGIDFAQIATELGVAVADLPSYIKGFSIVRVPRDAQILAQGIIFPTMGDGTSTRPLSITDIGADFYYTGAGTYKGRRPNYYSWYSPDFQHNFDGLPNLATGDRLKLVDYYAPTTAAAQGLLAVSNHNYYYKYQVQTNPGAAGTIYSKGALVDLIPEQSAAVGFGGANLVIGGLPGYFENKARTSAASFMADRWGAGALGMVLDINFDESLFPLGFGYHITGALHKPLANIVRPKSNLYGGTSDAAKANNQYIFAGHFQPMDAGFMAHLAGTGGVANNVEVFGGDCYVCMYDSGRICKDTTDANPQVSFGAVFPIESNINATLRTGRTFGKDRFNHSTEAPDGIDFPNHPESYDYQSVFSNIESQIFFEPKPLGFVSQKRNDKLVIYSLQKTDGEIIDNFKQFKPNNYRYADGQYGSIISIDGNGDRLFYWQQKGFGYMPVGERVSIGAPLGNAIQLGVGGTLERQDEIDTYYGLQHPHSLIKCEEAYAWFDLRRRTMLRFGLGDGVNPYSTVKGKEAFFATFLDDVETEASPNIFDSDQPMVGRGIVSVYDSRFKMGLMTFKYNKTVAGVITERDFTIGFSKKLDKYIGSFSFAPGFWIEHNGHLLSTKIVRKMIANSTAYNVGDELYDGGNYICILAYTSAASAIAPSADGFHWVSGSLIKNLFVSWRGDICKFYGKVHESYISAVIRSPGRDKICIDNVEVEGNETPFTDVYVSNKYQTGQDLNISTTNRNYSYIDGSWRFNLPFTSKGARLSDSFIQIKMRVKNYTGDAITTSNNLVKRIFSIKSFLRKKL